MYPHGSSVSAGGSIAFSRVSPSTHQGAAGQTNEGASNSAAQGRFFPLFCKLGAHLLRKGQENKKKGPAVIFNSIVQFSNKIFVFFFLLGWPLSGKKRR